MGSIAGFEGLLLFTEDTEERLLTGYFFPKEINELFSEDSEEDL